MPERRGILREKGEKQNKAPMAFFSLLFQQKFPKAQVDVSIVVLEDDGGGELTNFRIAFGFYRQLTNLIFFQFSPLV